MNRHEVTLPLLGLAVAAVILWLRVDDVVALYLDDGWYIVLARALAEGSGFSLINAPIPGILPLYPPGFPMILALVTRLAPPFPANLPWFKAVDCAAVLAMGALTLPYVSQICGQSRKRALLIAAIVLFHPAFVFLATSTVMSEPVFSLAQLAAIVVVERAARAGSEREASLVGACGGLLVAATYLIRSIAAPLIPLSVAYLLWRRQKVAALCTGLAILTLVVPWHLYARAHAPTAEQHAIMNDQITVAYPTHFWLKVAGYREYGWVTAADLPGRVRDNMVTMAVRSIGSLHWYAAFRTIEPADWTLSNTGAALSVFLTLLTLVGYVQRLRSGVGLAELQTAATVQILLGFGFDSFRYMMPLLPFLTVHFLDGVESLVQRIFDRSGRARPGNSLGGAGTMAATAVGGLLLAGNLRLDLAPILTAYREGPQYRTAWQRSFDENRDLLRWVQENTAEDAILATHNPPMAYLFTERKAVGHWDPDTDLQLWLAAGVTHWVDCWFFGGARKFPNLDSWGLPILYRSPTLGHTVVRLRP